MKLTIEKAVYGGSGLAREDGRVLFVPYTLPGEQVEADEPEGRAVKDEANLLRVLSPSAERVVPRCAHFGECGGCQYQHASYDMQVQMKASILRETLERAEVPDLPELVPHTAEPWGYRNRTRLRIVESDGTVRVGYNRRGSTAFLPIHECTILAPGLWNAVEKLLNACTQDRAIREFLVNAVEVELFTDASATALQMTIFVRKQSKGFELLCDRLKAVLPELSGAGVSLLPAATASRRALRPRPIADWGAAGLNYTAGDERYWISRGGFFQVNRFLVDTMIRLVTSQATGEIAWDLYAGVGLFARQLSKHFSKIVAVEASGEDLVRAFRGPGQHAVDATTVEFLRQAVVQRERPDLIVMDPPRAGVGGEVCELLVKIAPKRIVYVSCDPVTLARDLALLCAAGYKPDALHMIDMFPQTFHIETITLLSR